MLELNGQDYINYLRGLDNPCLLTEFIKQTVQAHHHLGAVKEGKEEYDQNVVDRYTSSTEEVFNRMNKPSN